MENGQGKNNQKVPLHKKSSSQNDQDPIAALDEDQLMESIDNLDMLLANVQSKNPDGKNQALKKLVDKYGIKPPVAPQQNY